MSTVYVLNKDGKPLMPTTRGGHPKQVLIECDDGNTYTHHEIK